MTQSNKEKNRKKLIRDSALTGYENFDFNLIKLKTSFIVNSKIKSHFSEKHKESIERLIKKTLCHLSKENNNFEYKVKVDLFPGKTIDDYFNKAFKEIVTILVKVYSVKNKVLLKLFSLNERNNTIEDSLLIDAETFNKNLIDDIDLNKKNVLLKSLNYLEDVAPSKAIQLKFKKYFTSINLIKEKLEYELSNKYHNLHPIKNKLISSEPLICFFSINTKVTSDNIYYRLKVSFREKGKKNNLANFLNHFYLTFKKAPQKIYDQEQLLKAGLNEYRYYENIDAINIKETILIQLIEDKILNVQTLKMIIENPEMELNDILEFNEMISY